MNDVLHMAGSAGRGSPVELLVMLFGLGLVPLLAVSVTSFTRIVVVLGLLRSALGSSALPPNAVIVALSLLLSGAVMSPTIAAIDHAAIQPYLAHRASTAQALERGTEPLRAFMLRQTRTSDVAAFARMARVRIAGTADAPFRIVAPAFMIGELRTAFAMGFALALPFAVIDVVVAAVMMSLGMFMVSPASIALPLKLLLFVVADGWTLVCGSLVASFR
jgi:flagellar biosynthetic protein FliP